MYEMTKNIPVFKQYRNPATTWPRLSVDLLGGHKGAELELVLLSFVLLPFHFAKDHILYKQKNMLTVLGRKIGAFMYIVA